MKALWLLFIVSCSVAIIWAYNFSPQARDCKSKGGQYFLDGECVKITIKTEPVK